MTPTDQKVNNQIVGIAVAGLGLLLCLGLPWMTFVAEGGTGIGAMMDGMRLTVTGTNGTIALGPLKLPTWLIATLPLAGMTCAVLQARGIVNLNRAAVVVAAGITLPFTVTGLVVSVVKASPQAGILLVNLALIVGLWFSWKATGLVRGAEAATGIGAQH